MNMSDGLLNGGLVAVVIFLIKWLFTSNGKQKIKDILQKVDINGIKEKEKQQKVVADQIKIEDSVSKESLSKIEEIKKEANDKIKNILKNDSNISNTNKEINEKWENI